MNLSSIRLLFLSLLFAQPLLFSPFSLLSFELPKVLFLYLFSAIAFFIVILNFKIKQLKLVHYLFLSLLGWILISGLIGLNFSESFFGSYFRMQGFLSYLCYGLLFLISSKVFENSHFKLQACWAILISSTFVASLALIQFVSLWFFNYNLQLLYSGRVISTFGQANFLGAYLVLSLPFGWFLFKHLKHHWLGKIVGIALIVILLGVISTFSRSAYLALAVLGLIWGFYHYRLFLGVITVLVVVFGVLGHLFPNLVYQEWLRFQVDTVSKWSAENRSQIAQKSLQLISQKPLTGYGIENFSLAFSQVITPDDLGLKDIVVDSSHNLFLDLTVNLGAIGLVLFLTILIMSIFKGLKGNPENQDFVKIALCVIIAFVIIHQFSPVSSVPYTLFWISLGIINPLKLENIVYKKSVRTLISFLGITLVIFTAFYIVQTLRADNLFKKASGYEVIDIHQAISLDNEAIQIAPWINFYKIRRNFLYKQLGNLDS
ncbi:O-antigen ligase family protein [Candidatus Daviesbacteria bacterium]|nr:O-antigen ligase family protein [Candidatus Daviesbacteria bacterium]